jgi:multiple sugar transport system permease protein
MGDAHARSAAGRAGNTSGLPTLDALRKRLTPLVMILPVHVLLTVLIFIPIVYTLWLSFYSYTFGKPMSFVGLSNYVEIFSDKAFIQSLVRNVVFVNVIVYGELAIGLGMAVFFTGRVPFKRLMISIVMAPYAVSNVLGVLMWRFVLEPDIGMLNKMLANAHLPQFLWTVIPEHAFVMIVLIGIWLQVPFTFLILYNAILGVPHELYEAALVDGASRFQVFWRITVPVIMPAILISLLFRYIFAFRTFGEIWILNKGGPFRSTEMLSIYMYKRGFVYFEFGVAAAVAWVMIIITLLIAAYYFRVMYKRMFANGT